MIPAIISALATVADLIEAHPALAKALVASLAKVLEGHDDAADDNLDARRGVAAGIAAVRASAVQEAQRRAARAGLKK